MVKKEVLAKLIDEKKAAVLQIILSSKEEVCLKEVAEKSQVSITSSFRILQELVGMGVLKRREWKNREPALASARYSATAGRRGS